MNDSEIISLYFDRSEQAIQQTDLKYGRYCYAIAWNILRSNEDSEECVSDTWLATWNAIPPARPFSLKAFVGRITRNNALNRCEAASALKRGSGESPICLDELSECVSGRDTLTGAEDYHHLVTCINAFLSDCKKEQRIVFVRRYFYENSVREIAQDLHLSESKVKVTLSRLRAKLRVYLEKEGVAL